MDRLAATLVCQGAEIGTLGKNLEEAQDALKSWDVGKPDPLDSESGALPESIGTSTSCTNTVTKRVINYLLRVRVDMWPLPTEIRSWKMSFKSEVSHASQYPRAVMLRIAEIEDAKSMKNLETSASSTSKRMPDFENLFDFKIASGPGEF